jgi:energy-coupling factor transporter ATP-binding protein EcfA2
MLKRLHLKNFTVFADATFEFGPGLNVLVGTNGTGKSHVLKVGYAIEAAGSAIRKDAAKQEAKEALIKDSEGFVSMPKDLFVGKFSWMFKLYDVLPKLFQSGRLGPLVRWDVKEPAFISASFDGRESQVISFQIQPKNESEEASISVNNAPTGLNTLTGAIFFPAKEVLTLSWILPGSEQIVVPAESNYFDLLSQLRLLPLRNPSSIKAIEALKGILGGEINADGDSYFLVDKNSRRVPINMVAEGLRKFGILQRLLSNGSLTSVNTLFWDEPEANLNPALLQKLAAILAELAHQGFQIILATHSTDLLKEFHILSRQKDAKPLPIKYFGLNARPGEATTVVTTDNFEHLPDVVALEVELKQADELEEIFIREDREYYANNRGEQPSL